MAVETISLQDSSTPEVLKKQVSNISNYLSVGVVISDWSNRCAKWLESFGQGLGSQGVKLQVLTPADIFQYSEKLQSLDGILFQLSETKELSEHVSTLTEYLPNLKSKNLSIVSAFWLNDCSANNVFTPLFALSMKCRELDLPWLGPNMPSKGERQDSRQTGMRTAISLRLHDKFDDSGKLAC